jgi:multiple sugar transport system permease protein
MKYKNKMIYFAIYIIVTIIVLQALIPVVWMALTSFKSKGEIFALPPSLIFKPTFDNYKDIFLNRNFSKYLINSIVVTVSTTILALVLGIPAAYGFSRYNFRKKKDLLFWILSIRMAPPIMAAIPLFIIIAKIGILDTHISLIWVYLLINLPFTIWMMKGFIDEIPKEIYEAAKLDGCNDASIMTRMVVPLTMPGITGTAILNIIFSWNEFLFALILTGTNARTIPVTITQFITLVGVSWGPMCSAGIITILPIFIFTLLTQKHLVRGLTLGAIK